MKHDIHLSDEVGTLNPDCPDCKAMLRGIGLNPLIEIVKLCKAGVYVSVNEHKDIYETVQQFLEDELEIDEEVLDIMIDRDTIVKVQAYDLTPIGCYVIYHYDIETALKEMLDLLTDRQG